MKRCGPLCRDGRHFVVPEQIAEGSPSVIHIVENWYEKFRNREQD